MANIQEIASGIFFYEFDADTGETNISMISGWLQANLGELNSLIYTDYSGASTDLGLEEQNILKHLYLMHYYKKKSRNAIKTIGSSTPTNNVVSIRDEDSSVTFLNGNEVSKQFVILSKDHGAELNKLVHAYNSYQGKPVQVVAKNMVGEVLNTLATGALT